MARGRISAFEEGGDMPSMKPSSHDEVVGLYENSADSYSTMMETEIQTPSYTGTLDRLHERLAGMPGALIDSSCGSGHMLALYAERHGTERELLGVDLTPRMVEIAQVKLGSAAVITVGDMRRLLTVADESAAAVLSYFSLHHLDMAEVGTAVREWHRILRPGGQLVIAAWEGVGMIDYGAQFDVVAFKHRNGEISSSLEATGYSVDRSKVEAVEGMDMDAVYLEATRA